MYSWKVFLLLAATAAAESSRALTMLYQKPYKNVMFVPKSFLRTRQSRVLFLDDEESRLPYGRGEIDLTLDKNTKVKFDETDYEFTSPEDVKEDLSGNERYYEPLPRFRPFQNYPSYYNGRFGRPYAPSFGFDFQPSFAPALRTGLYNGWKARTPRVVFPYAPDSNSVHSVNALHTNSHAGPGFDNVVFRDQTFGLNDVGQNEEQGLQDINSPAGNDAFAERDANDAHRAPPKNVLKKPMFIQTEPRTLKRNDYLFPNATATVLPVFRPISDAQMQKINQILGEIPKKRKGRVIDSSESAKIQKVELKKDLQKELPQKEDRQDEKSCPQGGTCEFFFYCWMVGGLLEGSCGGLLKGCCHRVAKAGLLGVQESNSIEYAGEQFSFGPVINDESKCWSLCHTVA